MEQIWASGGIVYTLVLEASAERIESSSLSLPTKFGDEASMVMHWTVNPAPNGTTGSIPVVSTSNKEAWQSPAYCSSLENCRSVKRSVSSNLTASASLCVDSKAIMRLIATQV